MATITNLLDLPGSGTPTNAKASISVVGEDGRAVAAYVTATGAMVVGKVELALVDGAATVDLVPNASLTPTGTVYKRVVSGPGIQSHVDYGVVLAGTANGSTWFSLLTDPPGAIAQTALAAEAVTRAAADSALDAAKVDKVATQAGTAAAPTPTEVWRFNAPSGDTHGPFNLIIGGAAFQGTFDRVMYLGYNVADGGGLAVAAEPRFSWNVESHYKPDAGSNVMESYFEYYKRPGASGPTSFRPIFLYMNRDTGALQFELNSTNGFRFNTTDGNQTNWGTFSSQGLGITPQTGQSASIVLGWKTGGVNFLQIDNNANGMIIAPTASGGANWEWRIGAAQALQLSTGMALFAGGVTAGHLLEVSSVDGVAFRVQDSGGAGYSMVRFKRAADTQYRFRIDDDSIAMQLQWGPGGSTAVDTFLGREAAGVLGTTAKFRVGTEIEIDGALNHDGTEVGFYGTAPIAKQTGVAVTAAGIHAALVSLGLIAA